MSGTGQYTLRTTTFRFFLRLLRYQLTSSDAGRLFDIRSVLVVSISLRGRIQQCQEFCPISAHNPAKPPSERRLTVLTETVPHVPVLRIISCWMISASLVPIYEPTSRKTHRISYTKVSVCRYDLGTFHLYNEGAVCQLRIIEDASRN